MSDHTSSTRNNSNDDQPARGQKMLNKSLVQEFEAEELAISKSSQNGGRGTRREAPYRGSSSSYALDDAFDEQQILEQSKNIRNSTKRTTVVALLVVVVGLLAAASFSYVGIKAARDDREKEFQYKGHAVADEISTSFKDYEATAKWMHESCRNWRTNGLTREDFRVQYEYAISEGLNFYSVQFVPNVTHAERLLMEMEAWDYFAYATVPEHQNFTYRGFIGLEPNPDGSEESSIQERSEQPFYFPIHFVEPFDEGGLALDLWSSPYERPTIAKALETGRPTLTPPFHLIGLEEEESVGYTVVLYHPGVPLEGEEPRDLNNVLLRIHALLERASWGTLEGMATYLYDATEANTDADAPLRFLGASEILSDDKGNKSIKFYHEDDAYYTHLSYHDFSYEEEVVVGQRIWRVVVVPVNDAFESNLFPIIFSGCMIFVASLALALWMLHNMRRSIQMQEVMAKAAAEATIVSNLFPENVKQRLLADAAAHANNLEHNKALAGFHRGDITKERLAQYLTVEGIFGSKPIAELYPSATLLFADLVGFTAWSSVRDPSQVFTLLEIIYHSFDNIAKRRHIFKVETVGDCYVAACGLPEPRDDHAVAMCRFAMDCLRRLQKLVKALDVRLGPDTGELDLRVGLNSGPVTAGVLRGLKGRFQLFGDTMNTASRMESTGVKGKIQISEETAELLRESGHEAWLEPRRDQVKVKGKGLMKTYFLKTGTIFGAEADSCCPSGTESEMLDVVDHDACRMERLVEWNVEVLSELLKKIVARNQCKAKPASKLQTETSLLGRATMLHEIKEVICLPDFDSCITTRTADTKKIKLDDDVMEQLYRLITKIGSLYNNNPFHSFEHASHVAMSVLKMGTRISEAKQFDTKVKGGSSAEAELYESTFGLAHDPIVLFACVFSALIHDLDHQGVPNTTLVREGADVATKYHNQSVAEQNSVDLAWNTFMDSQFEKLRNTICTDQEEFRRFRQLVVNVVLATDLMDKELAAARKQRWNKAFGEEGQERVEEPANVTLHRKATIVLEHLMQASDVSHTMQHWHIFIKWNERLFREMYGAYKVGRLENDPSIGWYQGEMDFFDNYIIPLANKLETCGVFGVSKEEYLSYALINRKEWQIKGQKMVEQYLVKYNEMAAQEEDESQSLDHEDRSLLYCENSNTDLELSDFSLL